MIQTIRKVEAWFLSRKLKQKVRILFGLLLLVYLSVIAVLYQVVLRQGVLKYIRETNHNTILSVNNNLNGEIKNIGTMSLLIMENPNVISYMRGAGKNHGASGYDVLQSIYGVATAFKNISSVYIIREDGTYVDIANEVTKVDRDIIESREWNREIREKAGACVIRVNGGGAFLTRSGKPVISFIRQFNDIETQKPLGVLAVNCSVSLLENTYSEMEDASPAFGYFGTDGTLLCGDEVFKSWEKMEFAGGEEFFMESRGQNKMAYYLQVPDMPLVIGEYEEIHYFQYFSSQTLIVAAVVLILTAFVLLLAGAFISRYITTPMERLVESMDYVKDGWLKRVSLKLPDDEIGRLKDRYNNMLIEMNRLIEKLVENEKSLQKAELEALQEQIKPHFLYNTLDTIAYLSLEASGEEVYDAVETLGSFYRKFLSKGSREISVQEEVAIVKDYLKLQKLRYGDIFEDAYDVDPSVNFIRIPKLILQPLAENSLYHGIRMKGEPGMIKVTVRGEPGGVRVSVYDTGIGMTPEQIKALMTEDGKSFGLRKTIERIQNYYNEEDVYEIRSRVGLDCEVILKLPCRTGGGQNVQGDDCGR